MSTNRPLLLWLFTFLAFLLLCLSGLGFEKPMGTIAGRISLEETGFHLSTYDIHQNKVYALAMGPRGEQQIERGVWIQPDGRFQINQLPVGEYTLKLRAAGYETYFQEGVFVEEGRVATLPKTLTLHILNPSVNIASNTRVFTTKEKPHFWLNATGANHATVKLYRKNLLGLLKASKAGEKEALEFGGELNLYRPSIEAKANLERERPIQTLTRKLELDQEDWSHAEFKLSHPIASGDYVALVEVTNSQQKKDWNAFWFSVSDLGLIVKQAPEKTLVRAIDLNTLQPQAGVQVQLLDLDNQEKTLSTIETGPDGFATYQMPTGWKEKSSYNLLALGYQGSQKAYGGVPFWRDTTERYRTYFYTERPLYRLGQTVYYKGITRLLEETGFESPRPNTLLKVSVEDPDNNKLWSGSLHTNSHGSFHGTFDIPEGGKTGAYQVIITYPDGQEAYETFEVAQYRKPEYQVEVQPLVSRVVAGNKVKARIRANYFFGAPVAHAQVKYSIYASDDWASRYKLMPRPDYYSYFDDWADDEEHFEDPGYAGDFIKEGFAQTDENGEAIIEFQTKALQAPKEGPYGSEYMDKRYKIQAEVTDLSRMAVIGNGSLQVTEGAFTLFVEPRNYVVKTGEALIADITAIDYDGQPVVNQTLDVNLMRWIYDAVNMTYRSEDMKQGLMVTTDAHGKATVSFPLKGSLPTDTYYLSAKAQDKQGHPIYQESSVWVASSQYPYSVSATDAEKEPLSVKPDKRIYEPGETAKIMITAPITGNEGTQAIVAIEGNKLYDYQVVPLKATAQLVEIPIKADYAPNVYLTVTYIGKKHQFYNQSEILKISPKAHFINLSVKSDNPKYHPGDTVTYTLRATQPNGLPAKNVELSLGVVDESIYALRPETAENIQKFFYRKRSNWVMTLCSFPEEFSGGPDKIEPQVRKDFRDMAAWFPELVTNDQGIATATVKLPDNLTSWRATVRGIDTLTNVGSSTYNITATQDILVRLALPRFFSEGDEGILTAVVHNYTEQPQDIRLNLHTSPQFQIQEALQQKLSVASQEAKRFDWKVKVLQPGEGQVGIKAIGNTAGDALERKIPIRPLGIKMAVMQSGSLSDNKEGGSASFPLKLPRGVNPKLATLQISFAPSLLGPVLGNFNKLIDYPYGCTEQTMSRLLPSTIAYRLHQTLGVPLSSELSTKFQKVYQKGMTILTDSQHPDGGWGWWQGDTSNAYLTAYVLEGFALLKQAGYRVPEDGIERGVKWLKNQENLLSKQLQDPKQASERFQTIEATIDLAYIEYVLGLYGQKLPGKTTNWWVHQRQQTPPEALSYVLLALKNQGDTQHTPSLFKALQALANQSPGYVDWDHTIGMKKRLQTDWIDYTYRFTGVESTALALRAVLAVSPENHSLIDSITQWLLLQRDNNGWQNTKTTAQVLRALMEHELAAGPPKSPNYNFVATVGDTVLQQTTITPDDLYGEEKTISLPFTTLALQKGKTLSLEKQGSGQAYFTTLLSYFLPLQPGGTFDFTAMPKDLKIRREFFRLVPKAMESDGTLHFKTEPIIDHQARAGETVLMKVFIETPIALPYVIVDAALPSGGEVVENNPKESLTENEEEEKAILAGDWSPPWWTHQDILDDRLVFFASHIPAGKSEVHTFVRLEFPGTFQMPPVKLEGMYTNHIKAYSPLDQVQVVE